MPHITDAALTIIRAALEDADLLDEHTEDSARRVAQYLISSGYQITPDIGAQPAAA